MFRGAFGFIDPTQDPIWPLALDGRARFGAEDVHAHGYFSLVAPVFETYAQRDSGIGMFALNVLVVLRPDDFEQVRAALAALREELESFPRCWRVFLGERHPANGAPIVRLEPLLFRSRATAIIDRIERSLDIAAATGRYLVYGNGVVYRHLWGIRLPPGTVEYS
jgi:hypothetical protein